MPIANDSRLQHHFLVAMPGMSDSNFAGTLIYLADHGENGALGLVLNRVLDMDTQELFEKIDLPLPEGDWGSQIGARPVYDGGPVHTNRGFVLHDKPGAWNQSIQCAQGVALTSSRDILEAVSKGQGPERMLLSLGYAGWSAGQLEQEILANAWLTIPAQTDILFDTLPEHRLDRALGSLGVSWEFLSSQAGHA
jgi:putative transcriptional regulator